MFVKGDRKGEKERKPNPAKQPSRPKPLVGPFSSFPWAWPVLFLSPASPVLLFLSPRGPHSHQPSAQSASLSPNPAQAAPAQPRVSCLPDKMAPLVSLPPSPRTARPSASPLTSGPRPSPASGPHRPVSSRAVCSPPLTDMAAPPVGAPARPVLSRIRPLCDCHLGPTRQRLPSSFLSSSPS